MENTIEEKNHELEESMKALRAREALLRKEKELKAEINSKLV